MQRRKKVIITLFVSLLSACKFNQAEDVQAAPKPSKERQLPAFAVRASTASYELDLARQLLTAAYEHKKPRPRIWRFRESPEAVSLLKEDLALSGESPTVLSTDEVLSAAIINTAASLDPVFARPEYGLEEVDGPLPEEICYLKALTKFRAMSGSLLASVQVEAVGSIAESLSRQAAAPNEAWQNCPHASGSVTFAKVDFGEPSIRLVPDVRGGKGSSASGTAEGGGDNKRGDGDGSGATGKENSPERPSAADVREYREHPRVAGDDQRPRAKKTPNLPVLPAPIPMPKLPAGYGSKQDIDRLESLRKAVNDHRTMVLTARSSGKPRPEILLKETTTEWAARKAQNIAEKEILKRLLSAAAARAIGPASVLFGRLDPEVTMMGKFPEEVAYEKAVRALWIEAMRQDEVAWRKSHGMTIDVLIPSSSLVLDTAR